MHPCVTLPRVQAAAVQLGQAALVLCFEPCELFLLQGCVGVGFVIIKATSPVTGLQRLGDTNTSVLVPAVSVFMAPCFMAFLGGYLFSSFHHPSLMT
jgi:hypothetical protein